jgi:uncharacterized protein (DUF433 family)
MRQCSPIVATLQGNLCAAAGSGDDGGLVHFRKGAFRLFRDQITNKSPKLESFNRLRYSWAVNTNPDANPLLSRITIDPDICHGKPAIRHLRYPVESILEYMAAGDTFEDLLAEFPDLEREDLQACLEFAAQSLKLKSSHLTLK